MQMSSHDKQSGKGMTGFQLQPVGIAHSPLRIRGAPPIQSSFSQVEGEIEIFPAYREGLRDIGGFSHLIIVSLFHQAEKQALLEKPLLDGEANHGIFATRHFNRPNPIGISYVILKEVRGSSLIVKGIDLLDGTPVLDIKPYIPAFDSITGAISGWVTVEHVERLKEAGAKAQNP